ncbi:MAG: crossover junction endodeoxyribonuclease RuvC [Parcubacteria bacterium C7867-005]|nr:MAG: crossover junction endodeoxyribonuclease RuvC [Parcubacteria bacterium C7867-005]
MTKSKTSSPMQNRLSGISQGRETVLAIDPGFDRVGVAIMERTAGKEKLLFSECIETNRKELHPKRIEQIGKVVKKIIGVWKPEFLAIEKMFFNQNINNALAIAEARGVIVYEASCANLHIFEYSPQEVKIATTGYGKAGKREVKDMVMRILSMKAAPKHDDEIDAIALGIAHLSSYKHKQRLST